MEIIKKRLSLEPHISRHGSLIPYIMVNGETNDLVMDDFSIDTTTFSKNGNWGKIPYDIDIRRCDEFNSFNGIGRIIPSILTKFLGEKQLSFSVLAYKFQELREILNAMPFYSLIEKEGIKKWVPINLSFCEKLKKKTINILPSPNEANETEYGVYNKGNYNSYDISKLFQFLLKAMGMFIVDSNYIKQNNGVPEVMYYTGISSYLETMKMFKNSKQCCNIKEYEFMGGDLFYHYLTYKQSEIPNEIEYWHKALFRDDLRKITHPFVSIPVALNSEYNNIGLYTTVSNTEETDALINTANYIVETETLSPLKYLRRSNITYASIDKNDKIETVEFPMILDESQWDEDGNAIEYELTQPYKVGFVKNMTKGEMGYYYGDMIYRMDFIKEYHYTSTKYTEITTYDANGEIISGNGYQSIEDYLEGEGIDERYKTEYNDKKQGSSSDEFDVWDNPDKAKENGLNEFSNKTIVGSKDPLYDYNEDGDEIITGYTQTFTTTLYDFKESNGVVNIYYVIGGKFDFINGRYVYVDAPEVPEDMPNFHDFVKNPKSISSWTVDMYLYMKNELSRQELYDNINICFKGNYNGVIPQREEEEENQTWVFKTNDGNYIIDNGDNQSIFEFSLKVVPNKKFNGIRFFEQKKWKQHSFKNDVYSINMLLDNYPTPMNILALDGIVKNTTNAELVDFSDNVELIKGVYYVCESCDDLSTKSLIALEQDFGKVDMIVENSFDILFDRGNVTSFELHYKLGEINTMEDMENYGNNFFGV